MPLSRVRSRAVLGALAFASIATVARAQAPRADLVLVNGAVVTVDSARVAMTILGGTIVYEKK